MSNQTENAIHQQQTLFTQAGHWLSRVMLNKDQPGAYFDLLTDWMNPLWSISEPRALVLDVISETADTKTLRLKPSHHFTGFAAGQYVQLGVEINGVRWQRTFSLSSSPDEFARTGQISVTLKKIPRGRVTGWIHAQLKAGDWVGLSAASGDFVLPRQAAWPMLYIAAGSGITPIMSHLRELAARADSAGLAPDAVTLIYHANRPEEHIFADELARLTVTQTWFRLHLVATQTQGQISADQLKAQLGAADYAAAYVCGPAGFRDAAIRLLTARWPALAVHQEAFGLPPVALLDAQQAATFQLQLGNGRQLPVNNQQPLLDQAEAAGLSPQSGCRMGICYTCKCTKRQGRVRNLLTGAISDDGEEAIQLCVSVPVSDVTLAL